MTGVEEPISPPEEAPADEGTPDPTQLSITIDNDKTSVVEGDTLDFAVTVENLGTEDITDLVVSQTQPPGLLIQSADADGDTGSGQVTWTVDLPKGAAATLNSVMAVQGTPDDLLRLATVACATLAPGDPPLVCAAHSAQLPAGAAAEANAAAMAAVTPADEDRTWWYVAGGVVIVVLGAIAVLAIAALRRRARRRSISGGDEQVAADSGDALVDSRPGR